MKNLEETLNLPKLKDAINELNHEIEDINKDENDDESKNEDKKLEATQVQKVLSLTEKIDLALPVVRGSDYDDADMDSYAKQAEEAFEELMELGINVEPRHAGEIFSAATRMLKNSIEAKSRKINKKLKMIELQIKKAQLDNDSSDYDPNSDHVIEGEYIVAERNQVIKGFKSDGDK